MELRLKNLLMCTLAIFLVTACEEEENTDSPSESSSLSCTHYVDSGTYAYWQCTDFSATTETQESVQSFCNSQNSGVLSSSCGTTYAFGGGTYTSSGSCAYVDSGENVTSRWYYVSAGDGPSETALCSSRSGTFTAD